MKAMSGTVYIRKLRLKRSDQMEREQTTIRLPAELKMELQQEAEYRKKAQKEAWYIIRRYVYLLVGSMLGFIISMAVIILTS